MSTYSDYLRRKSHDAIKFGYSDEYPCIAENSKGKDLKSYEIRGNSVQKNKNLLPFPYFENTKTVNGITFTCNNDGSITANGTATALTKFYLTQVKQKYSVPRGRYWVSGCPSGGSSDTYYQVFEWYKGNVWIKAVHDTGSGVFVNTYTENYDSCVYSIRIAAGTTVDNLIFKPMLMSLDDAENAIPYPFTADTKTSNGVTFTDDRRGNVVVNGTPTATAYFSINTNYTGYKSKYFLFGCPSGGSSTTYGLHINLRRREEDNSVTYVKGFNDYGSGVTVDLSQYDYTQCEVIIAARKDATINNAVITPKMVDISYISQVPSFDNPIPIKSVGTKTKNLLPYPFVTSTSTLNGITITDKGNGTLVLNGTASKFTAIQVVNLPSFNLTPGKYWFSGCPSGGSTSNYYMYLAAEKRDSTGGSWQIIKDFTETGSGMVVDLSGLDYNGIYISIGIKNGATVNNLEFKPFIMSIDDAENIIPAPKWHNHSKCGIDIVNNRDGSMTFNGTCTSSFYLSAPPTARFAFNIPKGKYYFDGVIGGSSSTFGQYFELFNFADRPLTRLYTGSGTVDTSKFDYNLFNVEIWIANGQVVTDLVWKPRLVSIDYEPPAMYKVPVIIRGSNLINFPYNNGALVSGTYKNNGITYTINNDGTIIANGTSSGISQCFLQSSSVPLAIDSNKYYYFTGCPRGGSSETYFMDILPYRSISSSNISSFRDVGQGIRSTIFADPVNYFTIKIVIRTGVTVDNLVFRPMLVEDSGVSHVFEPYFEPIIKNIWIEEPLEETNNIVYSAVYSDTIEVPKLPSFKGTTIYETDTEVAPSNIKIKYVRK